MMRLLKVCGGICLALYPLLVLWVLSAWREHLQFICLCLLPVLGVACLVQWCRERTWLRLLNPVVAMGLFMAVALTDAPGFFKLYPILVSCLLLMQFGMSLLSPPTVIERFALLSRRGIPLPPEAVIYCRKVTKVWMWFFCFNIVVSACTALSGSWLIWTWYNGFISYILIGLLMAGEFLVRKMVQKG